MALTLEEVRKIATLARLRFSPEEEAKLTGQLAAIVDYIDQLQRFQTPEPGQSPGTSGSAAPEADDRIQDGLPREVFLANAPASMDGFLVVPEVKGGDADA
jgi:aspartyl-tRNA(Asn)/glutamyl-tRNA(Gln) amidotransferase subunit C